MKKSRLVNIMFEIVIDEKAQAVIDALVSKCMNVTGMTEEKCRAFMDLIIDMGFQRNRDPDLTELLESVGAFLNMLALRLGDVSSSPF